jgi:DnaA family protein
MSRQLALGIQLPKDPSLESFVAGPNAEALSKVRDCAQGKNEPYVYLWGEAGSGKTHLLLGACHCANQRGARSLYLDLSQHRDLSIAMLEDLESLDLICLDEIQDAAGDATWEKALFDLFNRLREAGVRLLAAGDEPATELPIQLADLRSRLTWGPGFRLHPLDDESRIELLQRSAAARGMQLSNAASRYILNHCPRDLHALESLLDRLDEVSLAEKKRPTIPIIQQALHTLEED